MPASIKIARGPNALLMTIWSEMMGHLSPCGLFQHDGDASVS